MSNTFAVAVKRVFSRRGNIGNATSQGMQIGYNTGNIYDSVQTITDNVQTISSNINNNRLNTRLDRLNTLNGDIIELYTKVLKINIDNNLEVQVLTTSNMTPYFYPTGHVIQEAAVITHGIHPLVTNNHLVPMDDNIHNIGTFRRSYNQVHTSKVYTNSLLIPLWESLSSGLSVCFTDPVSKTQDSVGWRFAAVNNVINFVAGPAAGEIVAKDVRCTNLYVNPPSATGSATVQVNGSISCDSIIAGGSNILGKARMFTTSWIAAMSYLQASTIFKAFLTKSGLSTRLHFKVRATLDANGLFNNGNANGLMAHLFVRGIRFKIVVTSIDYANSETTYLSSIYDMEESLTSGIQFYYSNSAGSAAPHDTHLYITISPTIYANVNAVGIRHLIVPNRTAYRSNPTGTPIEVACPPLRIATPLRWTEIRL